MDGVIRHIVMECESPSCRMRFPVVERQGLKDRCPLCGFPTRPVTLPYEEQLVKNGGSRSGGPRIEALLDNIRSLYNVGSMFRTSDGTGVSHLHLCGMTPTPDNPRLAKTALGAQKAVPWTYRRNGLLAAQGLKESGSRLWALEGGDASLPLQEALGDMDGPPVVLIVGNEISGVDPAILRLCDKVLYIPMSGTKTSLNASVAFGIAAYTLCSYRASY